jgi:hypothetical protein
MTVTLEMVEGFAILSVIAGIAAIYFVLKH